MRPELVTTQPDSNQVQIKTTRAYKRTPAIIIAPIIKPLISLLDTQINGLTRLEKTKIHEMLNVTMSTILKTSEAEDLKNEDCKTALLKLTFRSIAKVVQALSSLKSKDYIGTHNQEILMKGSVSEVIFLRSIPFLDYETRNWNFRHNPVNSTAKTTNQTLIILFNFPVRQRFRNHNQNADGNVEMFLE